MLNKKHGASLVIAVAVAVAGMSYAVVARQASPVSVWETGPISAAWPAPTRTAKRWLPRPAEAIQLGEPISVPRDRTR